VSLLCGRLGRTAQKSGLLPVKREYGICGATPPPPMTEMCGPEVPGHPQGRGCWTHRGTLGSWGPVGLGRAGGDRREGRAHFFVPLEERRQLVLLEERRSLLPGSD
jgi:hypothetical protein